MDSTSERISRIVENFFLCEPAFFAVYCTHHLQRNDNMGVPLRSGHGRIEYNEEKAKELLDNELEDLLRTELIRIMLKHPYLRQPVGCHPAALRIGSDMVIGQDYQSGIMTMFSPSDFALPVYQHFEWYAAQVSAILNQFLSPLYNKSEEMIDNGGGALSNEGIETNDPESGNSDGTENQTGKDSDETAEGSEGEKASGMPISEEELRQAADHVELWDEDDEMQIDINEVINNVKDWGSIPDRMVEQIKVSTQGRIDYRRVMSGFRASVISSSRRLTRMRPNRRSGFEHMGNTYELSTRLLVAVDVSGSICSETISKFLNIIQRFFKYGVANVDVIQFDTEVKPDIVSLKEARKHFASGGFKVMGRGGTSFQPVFDYLKQHNDYDGLVFMTDGYASTPTIDFYTRTKVLWVLENENCYRQHVERLQNLGRVCFMEE
ncbi:MAG: hypothetical protein II793_04145 [Bacteroidales bacterium]|nr:hypothetical protein [Bacteroidales bacterium]